jgi:hypothetical protein
MLPETQSVDAYYRGATTSGMTTDGRMTHRQDVFQNKISLNVDIAFLLSMHLLQVILAISL